LKKLSSPAVLVLQLLLMLCFNSTAMADLLDDEDEAPIVTPKPVPSAPEKKPVLKPTPKATDSDAASDANSKASPIKPGTKNPSAKATPTAPGVKSNKDEVGAPTEPVHFESKGLRGLKEKGTVELIEEVIITQGELRLEADRAKIFYDESQKEVARVLAEGNVKIFNVERSTGEKMKAFSNQVEFLNKNRTVIMEGNARLWRGTQSVIRGKKITYEIDSGWIKGDRVAGELQPEEKDKEKKIGEPKTKKTAEPEDATK
jgi:lipopolysaccharide transport protein LptA